MCGIAFIAGAHEPDAIQRMANAIRHRGPDALTTGAYGACSIGHARLSIIDLVSGDQPMTDASRNLWIALNGEIYNYRELRAELEREGATFRTQSDTEVLLEGWKRWGRALLDRVRGMFAFAIWNESERSLFAARDLFGEKPFYYAIDDRGALLAASELKAIVASGAIAPRISNTSLDAFLSFGYIPPDRTVYENVHVLPPAHTLEWRDGKVRIEPYWKPRFEKRAMSLEDAAAEVLHRMDVAVERQMVADVPVGAFLSGGLDSSSIVALMSKHTLAPVKTFSVGFGDAINELPYARAVANLYKTEHHEIDLGAPNVGELLLRMVDVYDEPFADSSNMPVYRIAEYARKFVKVVLSGDGGDELFGGYWWYLPLAASEKSMRFALAQWVVLRLVGRVARVRSRALQRRATAAGLAGRWRDIWTRDMAMQTLHRPARRRRLWGNREVELYTPNGLFMPGDDVRGLDRAFHFDLTHYLPGDILVKVDRAAMAHGLETRAPFLDRDLVELALSLPPSFKVSEPRTKLVMREALQHLWPEEVRARGKMGFGAPTPLWLNRADVQSLIRHVARSGGALRDLLPGVTERDLQRPDYASWILLTLGLWLERKAGSLPAEVAA